jgi:hypothetical protein
MLHYYFIGTQNGAFAGVIWSNEHNNVIKLKCDRLGANGAKVPNCEFGKARSLNCRLFIDRSRSYRRNRSFLRHASALSRNEEFAWTRKRLSDC